MKTIKDIDDILHAIEFNMFTEKPKRLVIELLREKLRRLTKSDEEFMLSHFSFDMFEYTLPFITYSLNFFKDNTINLPLKFQQDLVLKYLINYEQIISSTEDIFVNHKRYEHPLKELIS